MSLNKTATFSLYSSLSFTTMDLLLWAGRIFADPSFLRSSRAVSCSFVMLTVAGTLQFLRMFATETRIMSFADRLRLPSSVQQTFVGRENGIDTRNGCKEAS